MLIVKDLNIEFHDKLLPETVVYDFNIQMGKGDIIGIVGESGSGKTITALTIAGLLNRGNMKKKGQILYDNIDLLHCARSDLRKYQGNEITMIFQEPMNCLNPVKKIGWQVEESLKIHTKLNKKERYEKVIKALEEVELLEPELLYHKYPHQLSGGMRQRVMIAAAMICTPKLLIADEPTTALDVSTQEQIVVLLRKLSQEKGTGILFISHDLSLVGKLCNRVLVMKEGYVVEEGLVEDIFQYPKEDYTKALIAAIPKYIRKKNNYNQIN